VRAILTYHSLDDSGSPISVSPDVFRAHVSWLAAGHVRVLPLGAVVDEANDRDASDAVAITFDDACANVGSVGAPLLADHGLPYTLFAVTQFVGRTNLWDGSAEAGIPELRLLSWEELGRLHGEGAEIGAHTRTHRRLPAVARSLVDDELAGSAAAIAAELGIQPQSFAYPYGAYDRLVADRARALFRWSCTTDLRALRPTDDRALLPRLDMYYFRHVGQLEAWGTPAFRHRLWVRSSARRLKGFARQVGVLS
jgi:peptidoglycan/xylan/chitin deacetylase (PgdA/CDA1 family)